MTERMELASKDTKTTIIHIINMFQDLEKRNGGYEKKQ